MFKPLIAATIGLSAMASFASADTIIVQSGPNSAVPHLSAPFGATNSIIAYDGPSFGRMVEMCARFSFNCDVPGADDVAVDGPHPLFSPQAQADAEKRLALQALEWEDYAAQIRPRGAPQPLPGQLFGWDNAPDARDILSWIAPRNSPFPSPFTGLYADRFEQRFPTLTRPNGFWGPAVIPQVTTPHLTLPRPTFPRSQFSYGAHPRTLPHGGLIPWPSL